MIEGQTLAVTFYWALVLTLVFDLREQLAPFGDARRPAING